MIRFPILAALLTCCCATIPQVPDSATTLEVTYSEPAARPVALASGPFRFSNTVDVGNVDDMPLAVALMQFTRLAEGGAREITLRIDSFGGSVALGHRWGKEMEDLKKRHGIKVTCIVDGAAYSMGAVILESPLCDQRLATKRSTILFHNGSVGVRGTAADLEQAALYLVALNQAMALVVCDRIGMPLAEYQARIAHADWIMAVTEALALNVIDGVVSPAEIAPPGL